MLSIPGRYLDALSTAYSMQMVGTVTTGGKTYELPLVDWRVTADESQVSRYACDLTVSRSLDARLLRPYGATVRLWHRLSPYGLDALDLPAGVYRLTSRNKTRSSTGEVNVQVQGVGFETMLDRDKFTAPRTVISGSTIQAITDLIHETVPSAIVDVRGGLTDKRVPRVVYDTDRWQAIDDAPHSLARSIGAVVIWAANGRFVIQPAPLLDDDPVWTCREGPGGALVSDDDSVDDADVINCWVVTGQRGDGVTIARAYVVDDDPWSPTYALGVSRATGDTFGRFVGFHSSPLFEDNGQALRGGLARLATSTGLSESLNLTSVPNPALEVGDVIHTTAGAAGWKRIVSNSTWTPGQMSIGTRVVRATLT